VYGGDDVVLACRAGGDVMAFGVVDRDENGGRRWR